ncbi:MAG: hypothetical protein H6925_07180 [Holosporaceae bacterium]|nr:MAG: hypothetical protein H6925_07180 [Holosporaceae bacterium]
MNIEREKYNILNYGPSDTGIGNLLRMSLEMDDIKLSLPMFFRDLIVKMLKKALWAKMLFNA